MKNLKRNQARNFKRIVLPVDGSNGAKRAAKKAFDLAKETGVNVVAMYVVEDYSPTYPELVAWYPEMTKSKKNYGFSVLNKIKKMGSEAGVNVVTKLAEGHPDQEIIKEARKNDLIVMGCKGRSALSSILVGSICEKVFRHASSPLMVIR
jgi:nucleotide-binding universal stress UspA family protein